MSAYLEDLKRLTAERRAGRAVVLSERNKPLTETITEWFDALPGSEQCRRYKMQEFVDWFGVAPSLIGPALFKLGWQRKRGWRVSEPFSNYWIPPSARND
jgi:hypothetical protein